MDAGNTSQCSDVALFKLGPMDFTDPARPVHDRGAVDPWPFELPAGVPQPLGLGGFSFSMGLHTCSVH